MSPPGTLHCSPRALSTMRTRRASGARRWTVTLQPHYPGHEDVSRCRTTTLGKHPSSRYQGPRAPGCTERRRSEAGSWTLSHRTTARSRRRPCRCTVQRPRHRRNPNPDCTRYHWSRFQGVHRHPPTDLVRRQNQRRRTCSSRVRPRMPKDRVGRSGGCKERTSRFR